MFASIESLNARILSAIVLACTRIHVLFFVLKYQISSVAPRLSEKLSEFTLDPINENDVMKTEAAQKHAVEHMLQDKETFTIDIEELRYVSVKASICSERQTV